MSKYFYSEGYIYKGEDTICKMYGTDEEKESTANEILKSLNKEKLYMIDHSTGNVTLIETDYTANWPEKEIPFQSDNDCDCDGMSHRDSRY